MFNTLIKRLFFPQEILAVPFLLFVIYINIRYHLRFEILPPIVYWLFSLTVTFFSVGISWHVLKNAISYLYVPHFQPLAIRWHELWKYFRIALSLGLVLVIYENLQYTIAHVSPVDQDAALLWYDRVLFGDPHVTLRLQAMVNPMLTEFLNLAYMSFFFLLPALVIIFFFKKRLKVLSLLALTTTLTFFLGYMLYISFPAVGPGVYLSDYYTYSLSGYEITNFTNNLVNSYGLPRGTFPSLHVACSSVYLYFAYKHTGKIFYIFLPVIISLWFSTIYLRHHYLIDVIAGFCLAIISITLAKYIDKKWSA
ncbi:MAG: phosphatase PAP2 family protein [bacterium]|nr:phosphatase PAP2 family protein [bacterium]